MATHRYWRLYVTANRGGAYVSIDALEMRTLFDGTGSNLSVAGNGTAYSSSDYSISYLPANAFDANTSTRWNSGNAAALPQWIKWDFGASNGQDINHLTVKNTPSEPTNCHVQTAVLQYSDDDSAWTDWITVASNPATASASTAYRAVVSVTLAASAPMPTSVMQAGPRLEVTMPTPSLTLWLSNNVDITMPMPTVEFRSANRLDVTLPMPTLSITGGPRNDNLEAAMPMAQVEMRDGVRMAVDMPMAQVEAGVTTTILIAVDAVMPMPTASMVGTKTESIGVAVTMPTPTAAALLGGRIRASMPMADVALTGVSGSVLQLRATMPMPELEATLTARAFGAIEAVMPMLVPGPYGRITAMMPMPQVDMQGRTVVSVTYEAYAVNLKPGEKMPHQVTRYTDFPFNQIVRYQGRYIAVADDGLYELGGDTDYDATTPAGPAWSWKTGITDFRSSQIKQVREAIVGARLGPRVTASVSVGEAAERTYAGTIVRGQTAQSHRVKYGRGLDGRYWSFGLADAAGGACDIDTLEFDVTEQGRKI